MCVRHRDRLLLVVAVLGAVQGCRLDIVRHLSGNWRRRQVLRSKAAPFAFFAAMMVVQLVVVYAFYPETKGVTLEEMELKLAAGSA